MNKFELKIEEELYIAFSSKVLKSFDFEGNKINYVKPEKMRVYTPDFTVIKRDGSVMFLETKGYFRPEHRTKMKHVKRCNPDLDIRMIFMRDHWINRRTRFNYSKWCERNDFPCAFNTIPEDWLI